MTAITFPIACTSKVSSAGSSSMSQASEIAVIKSGQKRNQYWLSVGRVSDAKVELMLAYWRALYGERVAENVAADLGASVNTARKWFDGTCAPSLLWFSRAISVYGPEFLAACYPDPHGWLNLAARMAEQDRIDAEIAALRARRRSVA